MSSKNELKHVFDLKGSLVDRLVKGKSHKPSTTLKDMNFLHISRKYHEKQGKKSLSPKLNESGRSLSHRISEDSTRINRSSTAKTDQLTSLGELTRRKLQKVMRKDVNFLRECGLMDYSMLVAIEKRGPRNTVQMESQDSNHAFTNGDKTVHLAIIDYLQEWNLSKKLERLSKTVVLQKDGKSLSAINPDKYAKRFQFFME